MGRLVSIRTRDRRAVAAEPMPLPVPRRCLAASGRGRSHKGSPRRPGGRGSRDVGDVRPGRGRGMVTLAAGGVAGVARHPGGSGGGGTAPRGTAHGTR